MKLSIGGQVFNKSQTNDESLQRALQRAHGAKIRPLCLCLSKPIELYIAHVGQSYILKRMPGSGYKHSPSCESYEPPSELSGLGEVNGRAIQEDSETGNTALKLDFSLTKLGKRGPNTSVSNDDKASVKTDGNKLTPRGLLHYLWHEAGFTRWSPKMNGKRSWGVIRKYLLEAASGKESKGSQLLNQLYIPEVFSSDHTKEIDDRRRKQFQQAFSSDKGAARSLMILIGEVKEFFSTSIGEKMIIKHLPSTPFMIPADLYKRLNKHFSSEIECKASVDTSHTITLATFERSDSGAFWINEMCLMSVDKNWIPFETHDELSLIDQLVSEQRYFMKGLRVNLAKSAPLAVAILSDTGEKPTALYVSRHIGDGDNFEQLQSVISDSELPSWCWNAVESSMPALPPRINADNT